MYCCQDKTSQYENRYTVHATLHLDSVRNISIKLFSSFKFSTTLSYPPLSVEDLVPLLLCAEVCGMFSQIPSGFAF